MVLKALDLNLIFKAGYWVVIIAAGIYLVLSSVIGDHEYPFWRFMAGAALVAMGSLLLFTTTGIRF